MTVIDPKFARAKFQMGDVVYKWTGDYTGPGVVRGLSLNAKGQIRYLVGHQVQGGNGEFLHVYAEGNLREMEGVTGTKGPQCPGAVGVRSPDIELVEALEKAHQQVDILLAMVIEFDNTFMPSQSPLWPEIERRAKLIRENGGWV
jgi:hypothetical protein